jgi:hypothetical protein
MLVSHRKKFIYTKTAKTGGTSVEVYFEPYCMPEGAWSFAHVRAEYVSQTGIIGFRGKGTGGLWYNHMPGQQIRNQLGEKVWRDYFKFCVIRDPFDKLVSAFHFFETRPQASAAAGRGNSDPAAVVKRFRDWVRLGKGLDDRDKYLIDGQVCVDYFIRYEELHAGIRHVCATLDIPFEPERLPHLKGGFRPANLRLCDYYDAKTSDVVRRQYRFEIEHFGYAPPGDAADSRRLAA